MSNLERYLRHARGINKIVRKRMIAAYHSGTARTDLRRLLTDVTPTQVTQWARADLDVLIDDEDANIRPNLTA